MDSRQSPFETLTMLKVLLNQGNQQEAFELYRRLCSRGLASELRQDPEIKKFLAVNAYGKSRPFAMVDEHNPQSYEQWMDLLEDWLEKLRLRKAHV